MISDSSCRKPEKMSTAPYKLTVVDALVSLSMSPNVDITCFWLRNTA